ncbi:reverse transcriptase domain-containing protein [Tanacetum coccineum]
MSAMATQSLIVTTVTKATTKEKTPKEADAAPRVNILESCEEHYEDILPVIMDEIRRKKRKEVHTRLDFGEISKKSRRMREGSQNSSVVTLPVRQSAFERLSDTYSPNITKSGPDMANSRDHSHSRGRPHRRDSSPNRDLPRSRDRSRGIEESYGNTCSSYETGARHRYHSRNRDRTRSMKRGRESKSSLSRVLESRTAIGTLEVKVQKGTSLLITGGRRIREIFQSAAQVECWAMPTWCHMFNSTLIGTARVWFDELPPESIDGYKDLKAAFLTYFMQQQKYVKDLVEIHNIKQRDGETIEDFMERFKVKTGRMKGAHECMQIFEFMHGVNNPELTKRLNESF